MGERAGATLLALGRCGIGIAFLIAPRRTLRTWTGREPEATGVMAARGLGGRDLALGAGALLALARGHSAAAWLRAGAAVDAGDALAILGAGPELSAARRALWVTTAGLGGAFGTWLAGRDL
jgi:hypothetical protein